MVSQNRLINGPVGEREVYIKPFQAFAYEKKTGVSKLFKDKDEYIAARSSGEWVDSPAKCDKLESPQKAAAEENKAVGCLYWIDGKCTRPTEPEKPKATIEELAASLKKDSDLPDPSNKYLTQMNRTELLITADKMGVKIPELATKKMITKLLEAKGYRRK